MIRWLLNKLTLDQVHALNFHMQEMRLRQDVLEENMKRLRAYVGYYKAPGRRAKLEEDTEEETNPLKEFYKTTIEYQNEQEAERTRNEGVGGTEENINDEEL